MTITIETADMAVSTAINNSVSIVMKIALIALLTPRSRNSFVPYY